VFEDESLLQVAITEAFEQAVAANFPAPLVRPDLRPAPSLGGSFVTRYARTPYAFKKYTRVPEVELSEQLAASMYTFRGATVAAALRAAGLTLPGRFRVHIYEAGPGTTLPRLARLERILGPSGTHGAYRGLHPLTVANATALLREPGLGVDVPGRFLESRHRIGVGQRFFHLQPVGQTPSAAAPVVGREAPVCDPAEPSHCRMRISLARREARVVMFFSEADAQKIAAAMRAKPGSGTTVLRAVLDALKSANRAVGRSDGAVQVPGDAPSAAGPADSSAPPADSTGAVSTAPASEWELEMEGGPGFEMDTWPGSETEARRRFGAGPRPASGGRARVVGSGWAGHRRHHRRGRSHRLPLWLRVALRRQIRATAARALADWSRTRAQEFATAVQDPACGVTVTVHVRGLQLPVSGRPAPWTGTSPAAAAATTVTVTPGTVPR
jgi:hypothetical protein